MREAPRLALALVAGAMAAAGQAPWALWPVALAGVAGGIGLAARAPAPGPAARLGLAFGVGHFGLALSWIIEPFLVDAARHGWMAPFALILMAAGFGAFWAAALAAAARLWRPGPRRAICAGVLLTLAEGLRAHLLGGFPWALPGHIWIGLAPGQAAAWIGEHGLTAATLIGVALGVAGAMARGRARRGALAGAAAVGVVVLGLGLWTGRAAPAPDPAAPLLRLVQPNADQRIKWAEGARDALFARLLAASAPGAGPRPDAVIWPESAVPFLLDDSAAERARIAAAAAGAPVLTGIQRAEGWRYFNSLALIAPDGAVGAVYDKHHLVPFGEFMPAGDFLFDAFGISAFAARLGAGFTPGPGPVTLDLGALGQVLPLICYEAVFAREIRAAPRRPDWILQVTNDAWFGIRSGPYQHLALARLRAIETGLPVVRVANTGVSALIDARGRVVQALPLGVEGVLDVRLPPALAPTPYWRLGDWPVFALLLALIVFLRPDTRRGIDPARTTP